jgi:DNA polymerase-3 subunit delta'
MVTRESRSAPATGDKPLQPWLHEPLVKLLQSRQSHALLLHGAQGVGQFELAMATAQAWLCEQQPANDTVNHGQTQPACGVCASCHLFQARTHPDFLLLVPDALKEALGWEMEENTATEKASAAKPSKDIKVEAVRQAVAFAQTTSARGRAKVLLVHPAERMNTVAANALLKTLEEPPGQARFVLSSSDVTALLPTVRSRCQALALALPHTETARQWLLAMGVADPDVLLAAAGGQPQEALQWFEEGVTAAQLRALPAQLLQGQGTAMQDWPLPRVVQTLQKICHDAMRLASGAAPRYFPASSWPQRLVFQLEPLSAWERELRQAARHAEHPWSAGLALQALTLAAAQALNCGSPTTAHHS